MKARPIYCYRHGAPGYRRIRPLRWAWTIRDGSTGPLLAEGVAFTERGAHRAIERAVRRCVCVSGVCRDDRPVLHPLDRMAAHRITEEFELADIPVTVKASDGPNSTVVLWPALALTPEQEAHVLHAVLDCTDAPVRWAGVA